MTSQDLTRTTGSFKAVSNGGSDLIRTNTISSVTGGTDLTRTNTINSKPPKEYDETIIHKVEYYIKYVHSI